MDEFSLDFLDIDPSYTFPGALGLLILYLCYCVFLQIYSTLWKNAYIQKNQGRITRKRRGAFRGRKSCQRDIEEGKKLLSILKSPLNHYDDIPPFRKLLCPDPLCHVCNRTTAKVSRLLSRASLQNDALSVAGLASTTSLKKSPFTSSTNLPGHSPPATSPEPCLSSSSNVSLNKVTPLKGLSPSPPPRDNLSSSVSPMDSQFWVDPLLPGISPCPCDTPETGLILRQDTSLCLVDRLDSLPTYDPIITYDSTTRNTGSLSPSMFKLPMLQPHAENSPPPSLAQYHRDEELPDLDSVSGSFQGDTTSYIINSETPSFVCSDVLKLLERQIQKRGDFLMSEDKEDKIPFFSKQSMPECQPSDSGELLQSVANQYDSTTPLSFASSTGKLGNFHMHQQQPPHPNVFEDPSQKKSTQLFWGLPSLHCESLSSIVPASGDCPLTCFNRIIHACSTHKPTVISCGTTLTSPQIQLQALSEVIMQSPSQPLLSDQFQAQLESPLPGGPLPGSQLCSCGVCFHMPESEAQLLTPSQIDCLEYNILQKVQKTIWGLPPVVQKSQEDFCPPAPQFSFAKQAYKARNSPVSILPGDFPLDNELRKKLEHHLRKRLIQHRWGLPERIISSLSSMYPLTEISQNTEKQCQGLARIPIFTGHSTKHLNKIDLKQLEKHHEQLPEGSSVTPPLEEVVKEQGHSSQTGQNDHSLSHAKVAPDDPPVPDSRTDQERLIDRPSAYNPSTLEASRQRKEALEVHLSKKFDEISKGQIPETVQSSRLSVINSSKNFPCQVKEKDLVPLGRKGSSLSSFPYGNRQKILEDHIKIFHWRMVNGLPQKVQESIQIFNVKEFQTQSNLQIPSSVISGVNSKIEASEGATKTSNIPVVDNSLSATLPMGKKGQEILKKSSLHTNHQYTDKSTVEDGKPTVLYHTNNSIDKAGHKDSVDSSMPSTRQAETDPETLAKSKGSSNNAKKLQRKMKNLEPFPMTDKSTELVKAEKDNVQSELDIEMTKESGSSPEANVNSHEVETTLISPARTSVPDPVSAELKNHLISELKLKLENRKQRQVQEAPPEVAPQTSDQGTIQTLLTHHQGVPSGDTAALQVFHVQSCNRGNRVLQQQQQQPWVPSHMIPKDQDKNPPSTIQTSLAHHQVVSSGDTAASQVLHIQSHSRGTGMQQREPWVPSHMIPKCQDTNSPSTTKKVKFNASKPHELGGGDAGLEKSPLRRKSQPLPDRSEKTRQRKSSPALSQKGQPPPENSFRNQIKQFFQWLSPGTKLKEQESSLGKDSSSSLQDRGLGKAAFSRNIKSPKVTTDVDQALLEKRRCNKHAIDATCPKGPPPSLMKFEKTQEKVELTIQTEKLQRHSSNYKATYSKVIDNSSSQEAATVAQNNPIRNRCIKDRGRLPAKNVPLRDKALHPNFPESVPYKEPVPTHTPTTLRKRQLGQVSPAVPIFTEGTILGDLSLLFKQKRLFQNFQRGHFIPPK
ncbi:spermatogenesis-associated protein 31D4-like isoform 1-T1 [Thomomys bottae]